MWAKTNISGHTLALEGESCLFVPLGTIRGGSRNQLRLLNFKKLEDLQTFPI
jgi:hypothetical protein